MPEENCLLCHRDGARTRAADDDRTLHVECPHCVDYTITRSAAAQVPSSSPEYREVLQRAAREVNADGSPCLIARTNTGELVCVYPD